MATGEIQSKGGQTRASSTTQTGSSDVPSKEAASGSILKKRYEEDPIFQKEMATAYVLRLLEQIVSDAIYEAESAAPEESRYHSEEDSDDSSDHYALSRLDQINEEFARMPTPQNKDRRVNFDHQNVHLPVHPEHESDQVVPLDGDQVARRMGESEKISPRPAVVAQFGDSVDPKLCQNFGDVATNKIVRMDSNPTEGSPDGSYQNLLETGESREVVVRDDSKDLTTQRARRGERHCRPDRLYASHPLYGKTKDSGNVSNACRTQASGSTMRGIRSACQKMYQIGNEPKELSRESERKRKTTFESIEAWMEQKKRIEREKREKERTQQMKAQEQERKNEAEKEKFREQQLVAWFKSKSIQRHREQIVKRIQEVERLLFTVPRSREQCEQAYKQWLHRKAQERHRRDKEVQQRLRTMCRLIRQFNTSNVLKDAINQGRIYRLI
ncbi:unnamed protein product [Dicrocoelium dendriticum]|nr:unnamed protein product [Dicrocoelium dendriticum]